MPYLLEWGYRVVLLDFIGHGRSDKLLQVRLGPPLTHGMLVESSMLQPCSRANLAVSAILLVTSHRQQVTHADNSDLPLLAHCPMLTMR